VANWIHHDGGWCSRLSAMCLSGSWCPYSYKLHSRVRAMRIHTPANQPTARCLQEWQRKSITPAGASNAGIPAMCCWCSEVTQGSAYRHMQHSPDLMSSRQASLSWKTHSTSL
jgi:hypothetical protein